MTLLSMIARLWGFFFHMTGSSEDISWSKDIGTFEDETSSILHCWVKRIKSRLFASEVPHFRRCLSLYKINIDRPQEGKITLAQWSLMTSDLRSIAPDILLRFYSSVELSDMGIYGYAMASSNNLREGIELNLSLHFLTAESHMLELRTSGDKTILHPRRLLPTADLIEIAEDNLPGTFRFLKLLLGSRFNPEEIQVNFSYPAPQHQDTYQATLDNRCFFDQPETNIVFPSEWLDLPVTTEKNSRNTIISNFIKTVMHDEPDQQGDTSILVKRLLLSKLNKPTPSLEYAAEELNISTAKLRRQLYQKNTSYKKILLEVRMTVALHYIERTVFTIQEIAFLLNYSEASAFSRTFKNYYGVSPKSWRNQLAEKNNYLS